MHMLVRVQMIGRPARQPLKFGKLFFNFHLYPPLVISRHVFVAQHPFAVLINPFAQLDVQPEAERRVCLGILGRFSGRQIPHH